VESLAQSRVIGAQHNASMTDIDRELKEVQLQRERLALRGSWPGAN
jgi:hypothetical protein